MQLKFALHIKKLLVYILNGTPVSAESAHSELTFNQLSIKGKLLTAFSKARVNPQLAFETCCKRSVNMERTKVYFNFKCLVYKCINI